MRTALRAVELHTQQVALGPRRRERAELDRLEARIALRVERCRSVFDDRSGIVVVSHLPIADVRAEECEVRAEPSRLLKTVTHRLRPVLAVTGHDDEPMTQKLLRIAVDVDVGRVRNVVSAAFEESDKLVLPLQRIRVP